MKVLLIGANGQLGTDMVKVFQAAGDAVVPLPMLSWMYVLPKRDFRSDGRNPSPTWC